MSLGYALLSDGELGGWDSRAGSPHHTLLLGSAIPRPPPQPAGACCRHVMARMGYQPGVKGEKHAQGHLSRPQTQGNFPKIKVLDSGQHRLGRRELRPRPQSPGRGGAWGTGPALWSLAAVLALVEPTPSTWLGQSTAGGI